MSTIRGVASVRRALVFVAKVLATVALVLVFPIAVVLDLLAAVAGTAFDSEWVAAA
jgi:hypothetical protein